MKRKWIMLLVLLICISCTGCAQEEKKENEMYVFYLNADQNDLRQKVYPKMDVQKTLEKITEHSVLPKNVKIEKYNVDGSRISIYFNDKYHSMDKGTEVLVRAAIVQTMTQLDGVEFVTFYVGDEPLQDKKGNPVGLMSEQDFVQNTGTSIDSYQTTNLKLYFADSDGKNLKEIKYSDIRYNVNTSVEKLVVEQLMQGTSEAGYHSVIPSTTKLLGVSVKDGICYVNFDSKFETDNYDLAPEVTVYAIVNSIIANGDVTKVQILIDGASDAMYKNKVDISRPFEWSYDLIKE